MKKLKPSIIFIIHFLFLQRASSQVPVNVPEYLTQSFSRYCESVPREEIYIHSDREEYISGEVLWFNVYLVDRQSFRPSLNSKIVYFELLNQENRPVVQKRIGIDKGFGPGHIVLPDTLSSGTYTIMAYTNWMKNFLPYNCFITDIKVFNPFSNKSFKGKSGSGNNPDGKSGNERVLAETGSGLTLNVNNLKSDSVEICFNSDEQYRSDNFNLFYLFIQTHGIVDHVRTERILGETTKITIPKTILTEGINQITIFNLKGKPICERFIYTSGKEKQFPILHSPDSCKTRSKITVEIEIGDSLSKTYDATNLSISVAPEAYDPEINNLDDYLVFGSEFGLFPWIALKGRDINKLTPEIMDSIVLNVKSNWIEWSTLLSGDLPLIKYPAEKEGHFLSGKLISSNQQAAGPDEFLLLSAPGKEAVFQYARTDNEGNFSFTMHIDEGLKDLIIQPDVTTKNRKIYIESSFSDQFFQSDFFLDTPSKPVPSFFSKLSVNYQVSKIFEFSSIGEPLNPVMQSPKVKRFYGKPYLEVILADFIKLPVMQEVFLELLPGVFLKEKKSVYEISITDPVDNKVYEMAPTLMIDGVIIKDPSIIADLDPEIVEKIDIIRDRYFVGDYLFYGIVNVITKSGNYGCAELPDYAIRMPYRVIDPVCSFKSPGYSSEEMRNSRVPDFRNTLYWNPSVKQDDDGMLRIEFWTSDIAANYEIDIQGITSEGHLYSRRKVIKVE